MHTIRCEPRQFPLFVCELMQALGVWLNPCLWAVVGRACMGLSRACTLRQDAALFLFPWKRRHCPRKGLNIMGKIPNELREIIARNIRECRLKKFPGRGGGKRCAEAFGVSPQQWSPWERGMRTPDEMRLSQLADFFGVTVEWMRRDNRPPPAGKPQETPSPGLGAGSPTPGIGQAPPNMDSPFGGIAGVGFTPPPLLNLAPPGSAASFYWLAQHFFKSIETHGLRLDKESLECHAQHLVFLLQTLRRARNLLSHSVRHCTQRVLR